jgi:hypothetical protein
MRSTAVPKPRVNGSPALTTDASALSMPTMKCLMVRSALFLARVSNHEFVKLILRDAAKRPLLQR